MASKVSKPNKLEPPLRSVSESLTRLLAIDGVSFMENTFITLHRKILQSSCFQDAELLKLWLWCLMRANHKDREIIHGGQLVRLKRGQFITGRYVATKELNMTTMKYRGRIALLAKMLQISLKVTNKYTIITVVNYDLYQTKGKKITNKQPTDNQQVTTSKEGKKVKKEEGNNITVIFQPDNFNDWYSQYPRKIGKKAAEKAFAKAIKDGVTIDQLNQGVEAYNQEISDAGTSTKFIKHPSTWLNQGCYDDDHGQIIHDKPGRDDKKPRSIFEIGDEVATRMGWE